MNCPRCGQTDQDIIHTCTPDDAWVIADRIAKQQFQLSTHGPAADFLVMPRVPVLAGIIARHLRPIIRAGTDMHACLGLFTGSDNDSYEAWVSWVSAIEQAKEGDA